MKKHLMSIAAAGAVAITGVIGAVAIQPADAQSSRNAPVILILNQNRVINQSKAGQSMKPQLEKLQAEANEEFNGEVAKLTKEAEELKKQRELLSEEVWTKKAQQIAVKQNNLPVMREVKVRELSLSEQKALGEISEVMRPILKEIVEENGATLLLERSAVMYAAQETDITEQVIRELDKKLKSVKVEKVDYAELQRQAKEQAEKGGKKKKR
ncbi:MAG: OmpH family outer membrane protein [Pseudomonadota bacterium]